MLQEELDFAYKEVLKMSNKKSDSYIYQLECECRNEEKRQKKRTQKRTENIPE